MTIEFFLLLGQKVPVRIENYKKYSGKFENEPLLNKIPRQAPGILVLRIGGRG